MDQIEKYSQQYGEYLEDVRKKIYSLVILFVVAFCVGFFLTTPFLRLFISTFQFEDVIITTTSPFQIVDLAMNIGILFAILVTTPFVIRSIYSFLKEGLFLKERKFFILLLPVALILFLVGFSYGFATLYFALKFISQVNISLGVVNMWDINRFLSQIVLTSTFLGLIFQFPVIATFLIRVNGMSVDFLKTRRRLAVVLIFIFVSLLPPTDGLSLIIMSLPLMVIYELTILFNSNKKRYNVLN